MRPACDAKPLLLLDASWPRSILRKEVSQVRDGVAPVLKLAECELGSGRKKGGTPEEARGCRKLW